MSAADLKLAHGWPLDMKTCDPVRLLALCIWREARGEKDEAKLAVGCVIRNRTLHPVRFGGSYAGVILKPYQFSSFNKTDPQSAKYPLNEQDPVWESCLTAAFAVVSGANDPTSGATHYFDSSLDWNPPAWATDGELAHKIDIGRLRFYGPQAVSGPDGTA